MFNNFVGKNDIQKRKWDCPKNEMGIRSRIWLMVGVIKNK